MANHIRSESEWGIAEPPAIQQVVVNVGSLFAVDIERGRQHTGIRVHYKVEQTP